MRVWIARVAVVPSFLTIWTGCQGCQGDAASAVSDLGCPARVNVDYCDGHFVIADNTNPARYPLIEMQPGGSRRLGIVAVGGDLYFGPVTWSIPGSGSPASISSDGLVTVDAIATDGETVSVRASLPRESCTTTVSILVFDHDARPLVGFWSESAVVRTDGSEDPAPSEGRLVEVIFWAGGQFQVSADPRFEAVVDYEGCYVTADSRVELAVRASQWIGADLNGRFEVAEPDDIVLTEMWLRSQQREGERGHRLSRWKEFRGL